jgi:hypothetical protein
MVIVVIDSHKKTHTFVAVDDVCKKVSLPHHGARSEY